MLELSGACPERNSQKGMTRSKRRKRGEDDPKSSVLSLQSPRSTVAEDKLGQADEGEGKDGIPGPQAQVSRGIRPSGANSGPGVAAVQSFRAIDWLDTLGRYYFRYTD